MAHSGASSDVRFELADPFKPEHRKTNPLSRVPALAIDGGPLVVETTLIVRTLNDMGHTDLLPKEHSARLQAEADIALMMGILDLGVAYVMESRRDASEQSPHWQERRLEGIRASYPLIEAAAARASDAPGGAAALALVTTVDWLSFRLSEALDWQAACPNAARFAGAQLSAEEFAATDPRLA